MRFPSPLCLAPSPSGKRFAAFALLAACAHPPSGPPRGGSKPSQVAADTVTPFVDPFIGTRNEGNVLPGPALPFGLVKLGPDSDRTNSNAGYVPEDPVVGFSHLHVSGTGGGPKYGVILLAPTVGPISPTDHGSLVRDEVAKVGYYSARLLRFGIQAELTATHRVGLHRLTFPASEDANLLLDVAHVLRSSYKGESQSFVGGAVEAVTPTRVTGYGRYTGGWNKGGEYRVYFCFETNAAARSFGTWRGTTVTDGGTRVADEPAAPDTPLGAYLRFRTTAGQAITARVGISFLSSARACTSAAQEAPGFAFDDARAAAERTWNDVLGRIAIEGPAVTEADRINFYTALFHAHLMPTERTGENPLWQSGEPNYDDFYAVWDTYRTQNPLLTLIEPERQHAIVRSLIDIYRHVGYLPDGRSGMDNGRTQGGSNADIVLADAYVKRLGGPGLPEIDWKTAYEAMVKDAEVTPADPIKEGRGGLDDYHALGYVSTRHARAGSRTIEYSLDDWAIAQVAKGLGREADYAKYKQRASSWTNLWNPGLSDAGFSGFIGPRGPDGKFDTGEFNLLKGGSWSGFFYESHSWEYSLDVPHDVPRLIELCGGRDTFVRRLDTLFDRNHWHISNEPAFFHPMLYVWAGRHDRTVDRLWEAMDKHFRPTPGGLPGNDDSGAMSAWYVFNAVGFYPNAGMDHYVITSPHFDKVTLALGRSGRTLTILAPGVSARRRYVRSATLNGKPWNRAWFRHSDITGGGVLAFEMSEQPTNWGAGDPPPSVTDPR